MKKILYIHGWLSSGLSNTSDSLKKLLPEYEIICPDLPTDPIKAINFLKGLTKEHRPEIIIGTSLGGLYATFLEGQYRIIINPALILSELIKPGSYEFYTKRQDGIQQFDFTQREYADLKQMEKKQEELDWEEKRSTRILLGKNDNLVIGLKELCIKIYGSKQITEADFGHRLNADIIKSHLLPMIANASQEIQNIIAYQPIMINEKKEDGEEKSN
jgi:uncharacterized protein